MVRIYTSPRILLWPMSNTKKSGVWIASTDEAFEAGSPYITRHLSLQKEVK